MIVRGDIKKYIGAVDSEETAAHFYDKYALIIQGFEVRTFYEQSKFSWQPLELLYVIITISSYY